jgi:hypothetical protein
MALSSEPMQLTDGVGRYKSDMRCEWQLSGSGTIELVVSLMALEAEGDALRVYDGPDSSSPLIVTLDGVDGDLPPPIRSSGGAMTVVFTSDEAFQREGFVATVRLVAAPTPSPTNVGDTWAPTTPTPTGPRSCTHECCAPHAPRMELRPTGVDAIEMSTSDDGTWSWSCAKDCLSTTAECSVWVPNGKLRNFTEVVGPLPSGLAMLSCKDRITEMYRTCVAFASQSPPPLDMHLQREAEGIGVQKHGEQRHQRQPGGACDAPAAGVHVRAHHHPQ